MNLLKSLLMKMHAQNKSRLEELYLDKISKIDNYKKLEYSYLNLKFSFEGLSFRTPERLIINIEIPKEFVFDNIDRNNVLVIEHYLLKHFCNDVNKINDEYFNKNKSSREKPYIESQVTNEIIIKRNGINYDFEKGVFVYRLLFVMPLINNVFVNSKSGLKAIKDILGVIYKKIEVINKDDLLDNINCYLNQKCIRKYIEENNYVAFIANGSILPRKENSNKPLDSCVKFMSPRSKEITIKLNDGSLIEGMGIKKGITVITGGGYSGKSTLLEAIEMGVYNHELNDGREYCITLDSGVKICAEDGRYVANTNISSFFKNIPIGGGVNNFSCSDASGSVSQAVNILEAVNYKSKLLLIDEDRSANNFMIRDYNMHLVVRNDPIIPFTNRIKELYEDYDVSTILVIGGSSIYLNYASTVLLLDEYVLSDISSIVNELDLVKVKAENEKGKFIFKRKIVSSNKKDEFKYFNIVNNDKNKNIIIDDYEADITYISTLISEYQINYLAYVIQLILSRNEFFEGDIIGNIFKEQENIYKDKINEIISQYNIKCDIWFEDIRKEDIICCINRLRGIKFDLI